MENIEMSEVEVSFMKLGLHENLVRVLSDLGYVKPFLIQEKCIPILLNGGDVLGLAQTGSGKTAAFILPLLHNINPHLFFPQVLILAPTRELAIQLSDVCVVFSKYIHGISVVSLYGGQNYEIQFRALKKGPQIVIGTPGRLLDHLRRNTLCLSKLRSLVIDEADEMLRMGFIEDVRSIILKIPENHQTALFSATFPKAICRIASHFMRNPQKICITDGMVLSSDILQKYWVVSGCHKIEALIRFLEVEIFDAAIVFVRTKNMTVEVSSMLEQNGYHSAALHGDMNQMIRQKTLDRLKNGELNVLIATDVAARGLDLERVTLVVNYDAPMDFKSYLHRIGRTGRAGRTGKSLLFIKNSEFRLLRYIERSNSLKNIFKVKVPSSEIVIKSRLNKFSKRVKQEWVGSTDLDQYRMLLSEIKPEKNFDIESLAAVLLKIAQGDRTLVLSSDFRNINEIDLNHSDFKVHSNRFKFTRFRRKEGCSSGIVTSGSRVLKGLKGMDRYRINVGKEDGVKVHHILRAMYKGDVNVRRYIGNVKLFSCYSILELSKSIPENILSNVTNMQILNKSTNIKFLGTVSSRRRFRFSKL